MKPSLLDIVCHVKVSPFVIVEWRIHSVPNHFYVAPVSLRIVPSVSSLLLAGLDNVVVSAVVEDTISVSVKWIVELKFP